MSKKIIFNLLIIAFQFLGFSLFSFSQGLNENSGSTLGGIKSSSINNEIFIDGIGNGVGQKMKYSQIQGSPFFNDEFQPTDLYDRKERKIGQFMVKFNLASQELHYMSKDSVELVVADQIGRVVMFPNPSSPEEKLEFISDPSKFIINNQPYFGFIQKLNTGNNVLYKHMKRSVVVADSLFGAAKKYYFGTTISYFMGTASGIIKLKKLSDEYIRPNLIDSPELTAWIKENKVKFNRETDVVRLLNYYNSKPK